MNRKRKSEESFAEYRASQNEEAFHLKLHLQGNFIHISKYYTPEGLPSKGLTYVSEKQE